MSSKATCITQIKDRDALVEVLEDILGKGSVSVNTNAKNQEYEIALKKHGAGYYKNELGQYVLSYNKEMANKLKVILPHKNHETTIDPVAQLYAKKRAINVVKNVLRGKVSSNIVEQSGSIRMKIRIAR